MLADSEVDADIEPRVGVTSTVAVPVMVVDSLAEAVSEAIGDVDAGLVKLPVTLTETSSEQEPDADLDPLTLPLPMAEDDGVVEAVADGVTVPVDDERRVTLHDTVRDRDVDREALAEALLVVVEVTVGDGVAEQDGAVSSRSSGTGTVTVLFEGTTTVRSNQRPWGTVTRTTIVLHRPQGTVVPGLTPTL